MNSDKPGKKKSDKDKKLNGKSPKDKKQADKSVMIKSSGAKIQEEKDAPTGRRKQKVENAEKTKDKDKNGVLKKKKGGRTGQGNKGPAKREVKKKEKVKKLGLYESIAKSLGFYVGKVVLTDPMATEAVQALDLQPWHLRRLRARFNFIDIDGSGAIDYDEFFEAVGEDRSPFTDKLFALIDLDGSGTIEFDEYVRVMATYCMFTKDEILRFCFECFDVDKSGTIDEKEFVELCKCINNASPAFPANFKKALEEFDVNEDGLIDYGEFLEIDRRYPLVLFPAFRLQDVLQSASLGESTWLTVIERYEESKRIEEYKANHGGKAPPDPFHITVGKTIAPCLFRDKVHIKVGKDMEDRHRQEAGA